MSNVTEIFFMNWSELLLRMLPLLVVFGSALAVLLVDLWWRRENQEPLLYVAIAGVLAAIVLSFRGWLMTDGTPVDMFLPDRFGLLAFALSLIAVLATLLTSFQYMEERQIRLGDFFGLLLLAATGIGLMLMSHNLLVIFLGLETLSLSAYVMAGFNVRDKRSQEASIKYYILGAVAAAFLLLGFAFVYGSFATLDLIKIQQEASTVVEGPERYYAALALVLILVGFGFKIAAVPFQWWTPDVYEGSPLPVTTFFATAIKLAAFVAFWRIAATLSPVLGASWLDYVCVISVVTMTIGNIAAIVQADMKRMLAYSSIAHAGYLLTAFVIIPFDAGASASALLFYLFGYVLMTIGAFSVLIALDKDGSERTDLRYFNGLGFKRPWLAAFLSLFLLSLAGVPPTIGFFAKYFLFRGVIGAGFVTLAVLAVLNSVVSVFYYIRPIILMYFYREESRGEELEPVSYPLFGVLLVSLLLVLYFGIFPSGLLSLVQLSVK